MDSILGLDIASYEGKTDEDENVKLGKGWSKPSLLAFFTYYLVFL
jgi:hypothetical protein